MRTVVLPTRSLRHCACNGSMCSETAYMQSCFVHAQCHLWHQAGVVLDVHPLCISAYKNYQCKSRQSRAEYRSREHCAADITRAASKVTIDTIFLDCRFEFPDRQEKLILWSVPACLSTWFIQCASQRPTNLPSNC